MSTTQQNQPLALVTPDWKDTLLMAGLSGQEGISQLFQLQFDFLIENDKLKSAFPFHKVVGEPLSARFLQGGGVTGAPVETRHYSGICAEFNQGATDEKFTAFRATVVPKLWLLTRRARSRIFQQITVPDILKKVLKELLGGAGELTFQLEGKYEPRDYCVQYRETDFNFVSRLMEEEGIFYFFKHTANAHEMVVSDTVKSHPPLRDATLITGSDAGLAKAGTAVVTSWLKKQELRTGRVTLHDHTFELPHKDLKAVSKSQSGVTSGKAKHELALKANAELEMYDWPGQYAQRFDGVPPGGGERKDIEKIFQDNERTTTLRMQQQASGAVSILGGGTWAQLFAGAKMSIITLAEDHRAKFAGAEGAYVLSSVTHFIEQSNPYRTGGFQETAKYQCQFTAVPFDLPFRPPAVSPKPVIHGSQSAQVVGPPGEEIFTDKYGRVKVQFHWDREGKRNADSSCWIRVIHQSAGRQWGLVTIPRIGQEVIVDFLEGDPDQPIVVGCVYNPDQMPMYKLPDEKTKTYLRSNSSPGGVGYNAIRFEDKAGSEQIYIHAQKDQDTRVRNDARERIGNNRHMRVGFYLENDHKGDTSGETKKGNQYEEVAIDQHLKVHRNQDEQVGGDIKLLVGGIDGDGNMDVHIMKDKHELIDGTLDQHVKKAVTVTYDDTLDMTVTGAATITYESSLDMIIASATSTTYASTFDQTVSSAATQTYGSSVDTMIGGQRTDTVAGGFDLKVAGDLVVEIGGNHDQTVGMNQQAKVGMKMAVQAGQEIHLAAGAKAVIEAPTITLKGAGGFITIGPAGVAIQGTMVLINSGGAAVPGSGASPKSPKAAKQAQSSKNAKKAKDAKDANPEKPADAAVSSTGSKSN